MSEAKTPAWVAPARDSTKDRKLFSKKPLTVIAFMRCSSEFPEGVKEQPMLLVARNSDIYLMHGNVPVGICDVVPQSVVDRWDAGELVWSWLHESDDHTVRVRLEQ